MAASGFRGIDHVHVTAPEELMDDVLDWYENCLGLEAVAKPEGTHGGGGWFRAGEQEVHVASDPHNPPHVAHFGLEIDEIDPIIEVLRSAGCHLEQATDIPGRHRFYTRDPAGNRIEIMARDEEQDAGKG
jgi:catechol 2,3-dioxygenase-like lactoylglutathione lyase family enzyme